MATATIKVPAVKYTARQERLIRAWAAAVKAVRELRPALEALEEACGPMRTADWAAVTSNGQPPDGLLRAACGTLWVLDSTDCDLADNSGLVVGVLAGEDAAADVLRRIADPGRRAEVAVQLDALGVGVAADEEAA